MQPSIRMPVQKPERRGVILVISAALLVVIFAIAALSLDVGFICLAVRQLQNAADAAALAGARGRP